MNLLYVILNIFFAVLLWSWSKRDFAAGHNFLGWTSLIFSAWNAASAANQIF